MTLLLESFASIFCAYFPDVSAVIQTFGRWAVLKETLCDGQKSLAEVCLLLLLRRKQTFSGMLCTKGGGRAGPREEEEEART